MIRPSASRGTIRTSSVSVTTSQVTSPSPPIAATMIASPATSEAAVDELGQAHRERGRDDDDRHSSDAVASRPLITALIRPPTPMAASRSP